VPKTKDLSAQSLTITSVSKPCFLYQLCLEASKSDGPHRKFTLVVRTAYKNCCVFPCIGIAQ